MTKIKTIIVISLLITNFTLGVKLSVAEYKSNTNDEFSAELPIRVSYDFLEEELGKKILNKDIKVNLLATSIECIVITSIKINSPYNYNNGDEIKSNITFKTNTDIHGKLHFFIKLIVENNKLKIRKFDFHVYTNSRLINALGNIAKLINIISDFMSKIIEKYIDERLKSELVEMGIKKPDVYWRNIELEENYIYINAKIKSKEPIIIDKESKESKESRKLEYCDYKRL